jgi:predicted anti-sigma-YlaC factor YlaD
MIRRDRPSLSLMKIAAGCKVAGGTQDGRAAGDELCNTFDQRFHEVLDPSCLPNQTTNRQQTDDKKQKIKNQKTTKSQGASAIMSYTARQDARSGASPYTSATVRAGLVGGLVGGVIIWIYEALVWVGVQHLMPLAGIPRNATGLVFGKGVQEQLGAAAYALGTGIHFFFALAWGVLFAYLWPIFQRRGYEATLVALFYAVVIWIVMHAAIMAATTSHPDYFDPMVVIGGFMSHFFYAVPLALIVKQRLADSTG